MSSSTTSTHPSDRRADRPPGRRSTGDDGQAPGRRRAALLAGGGLLLGAVLGAAGAAAVGAGSTDGADAPEPGSIEAIAAELAEGQQAESDALAAELAGAAEQAHDAAGAVLVGLATVVPPDGAAAGADAGADAGDPQVDPAAWAGDLVEARDALTATGDGADDHGVTRAAFVGALDLLTGAVETTTAAEGLPEAERAEALERVARDRDAAVDLWQAGAARLDTLVVTAGGDHIHLFLAPDGDPDAVPLEFQDVEG